MSKARNMFITIMLEKIFVELLNHYKEQGRIFADTLILLMHKIKHGSFL